MSVFLSSRKYITQADGIKKKRNCCKIVNSKYNEKIYINMDKLLKKMIIEAAIDSGDITYTNKGDIDTIDLLVKAI